MNQYFDVRQGNDRRKRLIQQLMSQAQNQGAGSMGAVPTVGSGMLNRFRGHQARPGVTNLRGHAGISAALRDALGYGGYGEPGAGDYSAAPGLGVAETHIPQQAQHGPFATPPVPQIAPPQPGPSSNEPPITGGNPHGTLDPTPVGNPNTGGPPVNPASAPMGVAGAPGSSGGYAVSPLWGITGQSSLIQLGDGSLWDPMTQQLYHPPSDALSGSSSGGHSTRQAM